MEKPTQKQIDIFWEWCGWHTEIVTCGDGFRYLVLLAPNEELIEGQGSFIPDHLPPIDLNNLFKYAVPNLKKYGLYLLEFAYFEKVVYCRIRLQAHTPLTGKGDNEEDALFWAIYQIIEGG